MSRMRAMFFGLLASIMANPGLSAETKSLESKDLNRRSGGILFGGSVYPSRLLNQRQKRKRMRQNPNSSK